MTGNPYHQLPPGLLGEIARYVYSNAPRPVAEAALVAAIGLMAGICGRAYNVSNTGLNLYLLFIAPSGTGKEAIASGISKLLHSISADVATAPNFQGPGTFASAQALTKHLAKQPSFVSVIGEFGYKLQDMTGQRAPAHLTGLKAAFLDLYNKSGRTNVFMDQVYSDQSKNVGAIQSPALSVIGESTPSTFYEVVSDRMVEDGLLPRFLLVEYSGDIPELNKYRYELSSELRQRLAALCTYVLKLTQQSKTVDVAPAYTPVPFNGVFDANASFPVESIFDEFERECREKANSTAKEATRQLWTRAHMQALKLAALAAVGVDPYTPAITAEQALWAIRIVRANMLKLVERFERGEVGDQAKSEDVREQLMLDAICEYLSKSAEQLGKYVRYRDLHADKIIPITYLQHKLCSKEFTKSFGQQGYKSRSQIVKDTIQALIDRGELARVPTEQLKDYSAKPSSIMLANYDRLSEYAHKNRVVRGGD